MQRLDPPYGGRRSPIAAFEPAEAADPSPGCDAAIEEREACCPAGPQALLACLQEWAQRLAPGARDGGPAAAGQRGLPHRLHYRIRCPAAAPAASGARLPETGSAAPGAAPDASPVAAAQLFDRAALAASLATLSPSLPGAWCEALLRGWPERLGGLHRIELVPGTAWVTVEIGLPRKSERRLHARRLAVHQAGRPPVRDAIVIGAGLAGCATADALARRGWRVIVVEGSGRIGGAVADVPLLAQHPALSPGADRRSRLLMAALLASGRLADRFGAAMKRCGRFQPMPIAEARMRTAGLPDSIAAAVASSSLAAHGVEGLQGIWFPSCAVVDPQQWWRRVLQSAGIELLLSRPVAGICRQAQRWQAVDARGQAIAAADVLVLANQAGALELSALPAEAAGSLRLSRIQVAIGTALAARAGSRRPAILGGSSYRLEDPGRCCVIGPLQPGVDSLERHAIVLPAPTIGDPSYRWRISEPGERLLMRDNLPMIGPAPDIEAIAGQRHRFARNDRLPLPRRDSLYLLAGLGGRGLLWSVIGAEMIAAEVRGEPPVVEPELEDAVDPARFLRRSLRRAGAQADGMKVLSS